MCDIEIHYRKISGTEVLFYLCFCFPDDLNVDVSI